MFHRGWERVDGTLIDTRRLGSFSQAPLLTKHECVVEFAREDGHAVRLKVEEPLGVRLPARAASFRCSSIPMAARPLSTSTTRGSISTRADEGGEGSGQSAL